MRFHRYMTGWDRFLDAKQRRAISPDEFYKKAIEDCREEGIYEQVEPELVTERNWIAFGRPYYKVWPELSKNDRRIIS